MEMNEKKLYIILIVLILLICSVVFIFIKYDDNNDSDLVDNDVDNLLIENSIWSYYDSYYHLPDGSVSPMEFKFFSLRFYDDYMEKCYDNNCISSKYSLDNNILKVTELDNFVGEYNIFYENDILTLVENRDNGSKIVYNFIIPVG